MKKIIFFYLSFLSMMFSADFYVDNSQNLMWEDTYETTARSKNYYEAESYCSKLTVGGFDDWRLPTRIELINLIDDSKYNSASSGLRYVIPNAYVSSSVAHGTTDYVWYVEFLDGKVRNYSKTSLYFVRCVREMAKPNKTNDISMIYNEVLEQLMSSVAKPKVQTKIEKGMFEKQVEFEQRINQANKKNEEEIERYNKDYYKFLPVAKKEAMKKALEAFYGKPIGSNLIYDAENEIFSIDIKFENNQNMSTKVAIKISPKDAKEFYDDFKSKIVPVALFDFDESEVNLKSIRFDYLKNSSVVQRYDSMFYNQDLSSSRRVVNLKNDFQISKPFLNKIEINAGIVNNFDPKSFVTTNDLELLLEKSSSAKSNIKKWAFIVGVENYKYTDNVVFAKRSAEMFAEVANKSLGVPKQNIQLLVNENATAAEIKNKMKLFLQNVEENDEIYFYYNGHGLPAVDKNNEPFILSSDMMPDFVSDESFFMLRNVYNQLSASKAKQIIAIVDSCFTGTTDGKSIQKGVAATKMKPKNVDFDKSKMVVLSAGKENQYSNAYNQKAHRLFSFFVMQELLKGEKNMKTLYDKVFRQTKDITMKNYGITRLQEPQIDGNLQIDF